MEKLNKGDAVEIINYGSLLMVHKKSGLNIGSCPVIEETENYRTIDTNQSLVGQFAVVDYEKNGKYALNGVVKHAWYNRDQLKPVPNAKLR